MKKLLMVFLAMSLLLIPAASVLAITYTYDFDNGLMNDAFWTEYFGLDVSGVPVEGYPADNNLIVLIHPYSGPCSDRKPILLMQAHIRLNIRNG